VAEQVNLYDNLKYGKQAMENDWQSKLYKNVFVLNKTQNCSSKGGEDLFTYYWRGMRPLYERENARGTLTIHTNTWDSGSRFLSPLYDWMP
jgi:hypothetical protein